MRVFHSRRVIVGVTLAMLMLAILTRPAGAATKTFIALLNGGQETPPTDSDAFGVAFMTFDDQTKMLCYSITFTKLQTTEVAAHFHSPAAPGQMANVTFPITPVPGDPKMGCVGPIASAKQRKELKTGLFYLNIHSQRFPNGEIRGQVLAAGR